MLFFSGDGPWLLLLLLLQLATAKADPSVPGPRPRPSTQYPERVVWVPGQRAWVVREAWRQAQLLYQPPALLPKSPKHRAEVPSGLDLALLQQVTDSLYENQAISPYVLSSLMTQVYLGTAGDTRDEMTPVLGLEDASTGVALDYLGGYRASSDYLSNSSNVTVAVFNRMYVRRGFSIKQSYRDTLRSAFSSDAREFSSPAQAAREINEAVADVTEGRIKDLVSPPLLQSAELVLVSALYFKALWQKPFNEAVKANFLTAAGDSKVDMMSVDLAGLPYINLTAFEAVAVPYKDPAFCLVLLRPAQRTMQSVQALRDSLKTLSIANIVGQMYEKQMHLSLPKFTIEAEYSLPEQLAALGVHKIFAPGADFSGMTDEGGLFVSDVIHKVFMEVTEEGTEAAGAAAAIFTRAMPTDFALDRPFFAVVYNRVHRLNLFSAFVASPTSATTSQYPQNALPSPAYRRGRSFKRQL